MRIIATLAVVFLHTCNTLTNNGDRYYLTNLQLLFLTSGNYLMNWSVPMFLMITGALLLKKERTVTFKTTLGYSKRILITLAIFGIPFSILEMLMDTKSVSLFLIPKAVLNVIVGDSWSHLWYLYTLIGIYLILPVLKAFTDNVSRSELEYLLVIIFIMNFIMPVLDKVFDINIAFEIPIASYPVFYILLGKYLYNIDFLRMLRKKGVCVTALIISSFLLITVNCYASPYGATYLSSGSPLLAFIAMLLFVLIKDVKIKKLDRLWRIDRLCFGVYLIHPVFINFFYKFIKLTPLAMGKLYPIGVFLFWAFFVLISFLFSWIMSLIKPLRKYVL